LIACSLFSLGGVLCCHAVGLWLWLAPAGSAVLLAVPRSPSHLCPVMLSCPRSPAPLAPRPSPLPALSCCAAGWLWLSYRPAPLPCPAGSGPLPRHALPHDATPRWLSLAPPPVMLSRPPLLPLASTLSGCESSLTCHALPAPYPDLIGEYGLIRPYEAL
jgi:hypothetical protein